MMVVDFSENSANFDHRNRELLPGLWLCLAFASTFFGTGHRDDG